ncbi:hypothetical protein DFJ66_0069 [Saccharothrix variisporea]|uniref:Uncharacterized protein n=1 Tax=Saccharothrix variisporea TaxID=543527 RepID=A0A495X111_9PSEU|nr:hypothetical protein DFJ66_0069 [Saccharothrix variisporea]
MRMTWAIVRGTSAAARMAAARAEVLRWAGRTGRWRGSDPRPWPRSRS